MTVTLESIEVTNYKSIKQTEVSNIGNLSVLIGKNDAGKSSMLEAVRMFLEEKRKPDQSQFHMGTEEDIVISGEFRGIPPRFSDALADDIDASDGTLNITRQWEYPDPRRSMADTYLGTNDHKLTATTLRGEYEELNKRGVRRELFDLLPEPIYIPAERDIAEETTFKSNTLIDDLLSPLLEESAGIREPREQLEESLDDEVSSVGASVEQELTARVDSIRSLEIDPGTVDLSSAFSPSIRVVDEYSERSVPIEERGSGIGSMLVLSLVETLRKRQIGGGYMMLFEEPGNWLHPEAKRRMLEALKQISRTEGQVMLSTHSPVFIDQRGSGDIFYVERDQGRTSVRQIQNNLLTVVESLGLRNSDILQSDFVVYVEGPTNVGMLQVVANNCLDPEDRARVTVQHLGGKNNLSNTNISNLGEINKNFAFLLDSDRRASDESPSKEVELLRRKVRKSEYGAFVHALEKREIENYFSHRAINRQLSLDVDGSFVGDYEDIPDKIGREIQRTHIGEEAPPQTEVVCEECGYVTHQVTEYDKSKGEEVVRDMYEHDESIDEIETFFDRVASELS